MAVSCGVWTVAPKIPGRASVNSCRSQSMSCGSVTTTTIAYRFTFRLQFVAMPDIAPPRPATVAGTGGELLARLLVAAGVQEVFGVPAGKLSGFLKAVGADGRLRHVGVRHEASAAWAAAAVFQATGRLAVAYGESGPGSHNLVGGLGSAWANGLAVIVLTADPPVALSDPNVGLTMDADNRALFAACAKERLVARDAARLPELVHRAARVALAGRPGPVVLSVSADVLAQVVELPAALVDAPPEH